MAKISKSILRKLNKVFKMALYINAQNLFIEGRSHFVTLDNKVDSIVTKKLRSEEPGLPFF